MAKHRRMGLRQIVCSNNLRQLHGAGQQGAASFEQLALVPMLDGFPAGLLPVLVRIRATLRRSTLYAAWLGAQGL